MTQHRVTVRFLALGLPLVLLGLAGQARGQNALGDGRALDARLNRYDAQANPPVKPRDIRSEVQFRNAVVTGNTTGGTSFRGTKPYYDSSSFTAKLGSDDLFAFRRDSISSGLGGVGYRGTDALQYGFAMTTGGIVDRGLTNSAPRAEIENRLQSSSSWSRSTASYSTTRTLTPTGVGYRNGRDQRPQSVIASPLLGVQAEDLPEEATQRMLRGGKDLAKAAESLLKGQSAAVNLGGEKRSSSRSSLQELKPTSDAKTGDNDVMERLEKGFKPDDGKSSLKDRLERLRMSMVQGERKKSMANVAKVKDDEPSLIDREQAAYTRMLDQDVLKAIRDHTGIVDQYIKSGEAKDNFGRELMEAQRLMGSRRYFDAEDRFGKAVMSNSANAASQAGRVHAEIGAGAYMSASVNLRALLTENPQYAGVRFAPQLLPPPQRLKEVIEDLSRRLDTELAAASKARDRSGVPGPALLLAYTAYQANDAVALRKGLDALRDASLEDPGNGALERYLRAVWLNENPEAGETK